MPDFQMAVEAREQRDVCGMLVDSPITQPDHPMVRYADAFTRNFDLIAERKSVVFHLREQAKASILAKFLLESNIKLEPAWFD